MAPYKPPKLIKPPSKPFVAYHSILASLSRRLTNSRPVLRQEEGLVPNSSTTEPLITVVCISDTHNTQPDLPPGDILLHAGDLTEDGSYTELQSQLDWLKSQPHTHKIVISGNHDLLLDTAFVKKHPTMVEVKPGATREDLDFGNLKYLCDEGITLSLPNIAGSGKTRKLNIYGSPTTIEYGTRAFQVLPIQDVWTKRLSNTYSCSSPSGVTLDILLTHGPPKNHLDEDGKGSEFLTREIARVRPSLVVFGHIHPGYGQESVVFDKIRNTAAEIEASRAGLIALIVLTWLVFMENFLAVTLPSYLASIRRRERITRFVNAAVVGGKDKSERRKPIVVFI